MPHPPQQMKRTVLSDSLESELNSRSTDPSWSFEVRESTCAKEDCHCELVCVTWSCPNRSAKPMVKTWYVDEVLRRKSIGDFAQAMLDPFLRKPNVD